MSEFVLLWMDNVVNFDVIQEIRGLHYRNRNYLELVLKTKLYESLFRWEIHEEYEKIWRKRKKYKCGEDSCNYICK